MVAKFEIKDIGMMQYFLGLEVWKRPREIFLGKGKYVVEILKIFLMEGYIPMATPMIINMKNFTTLDSYMVDLMFYR
jgi:hypothetical protein